MLLAPVVWVLTVVICYFFVAKTWWFPPPINAARDGLRRPVHAHAGGRRHHLLPGAIRARATSSSSSATTADAPRYSHGNNKLETLWTSATAALFLGLVLMGTKIWAGVHFDEAPPDAMPDRSDGQAVRLELPLSRARRQVRPHRPQTDQRRRRQSVRPRRQRSRRQRRHRQRLAQSSGRQADQADHALARRDPQFLRPRAAHEAGHRARHGDSRCTSRPTRSAFTKSPARSCAAWAISRCAPPCR